MPGNLVELSRCFRALNTNVEAAVRAEESKIPLVEAAFDRVESLFAEVEKTLSRFRPDSELSRLNASAGWPFKVSRLTFEVIKASLDAARLTGGLFDPTILPSLVAAGYDCSFERIGSGHPARLTCQTSQSRCSWRDIRLDARTCTIYMPAGCVLDLGGIGKGWTVDRASRELKDFPGYALDAGGDIAIGGNSPDEPPWAIGVADPRCPERDMLVLELTQGAVCTSTTSRRRWQTAGGWQHHLIDPRTGRPSDSGVISATVLAGSAASAETLTKAAILLGPEEGIRFIETQENAKGLLVLEDGQVLYSAGFSFPVPPSFEERVTHID